MKRILGIVIVMFGIILMSGCGKKTEVKKPEVKNEKEVIEDQKIDSLKFHSFSAYFDKDDKQSYIYFEIENTSEEAVDISGITYSLYDKDRLIISIPEDIDGPIEPRDSRVITASIDIDLSNVNKVTYSVK